jgi:dUTPase
MKLKFKKLHENAVLPSYAHEGEDAALDLTCVSKTIVLIDGDRKGEYEFLENNESAMQNLINNFNPNVIYIKYKFGLAVEIPKQHVGLIFPRSSISDKPMILSNSVGIIDPSPVIIN